MSRFLLKMAGWGLKGSLIPDFDMIAKAKEENDVVYENG